MPNPLCSQCGGTGKFFSLPVDSDPDSLLDYTIGYDCPCSFAEKKEIWARRIGFGDEITQLGGTWCDTMIKENLFAKNILFDASKKRDFPRLLYSMVYGTCKYYWDHPLVNEHGKCTKKPDIMFIPSVDTLLRYLLTDEPDLDNRIFNCDVLIVPLIAAATDKVNHRLRMLFDTKSSGFRGVIWFVRVTTTDFEATCNPETMGMLKKAFLTVHVEHLLKGVGVAPQEELPKEEVRFVAPPPTPKQPKTGTALFQPKITVVESQEEDSHDEEEPVVKSVNSLTAMNQSQYRESGKSSYKFGRKSR